jgi:hypothetical protein
VKGGFGLPNEGANRMGAKGQITDKAQSTLRPVIANELPAVKNFDRLFGFVPIARIK